MAQAFVRAQCVVRVRRRTHHRRLHSPRLPQNQHQHRQGGAQQHRHPGHLPQQQLQPLPQRQLSQAAAAAAPAAPAAAAAAAAGAVRPRGLDPAGRVLGQDGGGVAARGLQDQKAHPVVVVPADGRGRQNGDGLRQDAEQIGHLQGRGEGLRPLQTEHRPDPRGAVQFLLGQSVELAQSGAQCHKCRGLEVEAVAEAAQRNSGGAVELEPSHRAHPVHLRSEPRQHSGRVQTGGQTSEQAGRAQHEQEPAGGRLHADQGAGGAGPVVRSDSVRLPDRQSGQDREQPVQLPVERQHHGRPGPQSGPQDRQRPAHLPGQRVGTAARVSAAEKVRGVPLDPAGESVRVQEVDRGNDSGAEDARQRRRFTENDVRK